VSRKSGVTPLFRPLESVYIPEQVNLTQVLDGGTSIKNATLFNSANCQ
jgi:hypothetical protein